jgi:hypothetical protein
MAGTAIKENDMNTEYESKLLRKDSLVREDVFISDPRVLEDVREALAAGLTPSGFTVHEEVVVLRFDKREKAE